MEIDHIEGGHVTSPQGFLAGGVCAGMYAEGPKAGGLDLGMLVSDRDCSAAGVFTTNRVRSGPVEVSERRAKSGVLRGIVANSGNANAPFAPQGVADAEEMARIAAGKAGVPEERMAVASTGVTGVPLPLDKIRAGIPRVELSQDGGPEFARAIMTTDTVAKEFAVRVKDRGRTLYTVAGCCKGSGMIHPNMATMLAYVTTDAAVDIDCLRDAVRETADATFNMVTVDGDTSCSDTFIVFANGAAGGQTIRSGTPQAQTFLEALMVVTMHLARALARDGEGASHLITVDVRGATSQADARQLARTVALSSLVKTAVAGADPNWGRILVAAGRSGAKLDVAKTKVTLQGEALFDRGKVLPFDALALHTKLRDDEVIIGLDLGLGSNEATAWGCDLTTEYVHINADYTT